MGHRYLIDGATYETKIMGEPIGIGGERPVDVPLREIVFDDA